LTDTASALHILRTEVDAIKAMPDGPEKDARKRPIIERLTLSIRARTDVIDGRKRLTITVRYAHQPPAVRCVSEGLQHDIHHRSQIDTYAGMLGWSVPDIFARSAEQVGSQQDAQRALHGR